MRELDTTFVLLIRCDHVQPVSAEALQPNFTGAESSAPSTAPGMAKGSSSSQAATGSRLCDDDERSD